MVPGEWSKELIREKQKFRLTVDTHMKVNEISADKAERKIHSRAVISFVKMINIKNRHVGICFFKNEDDLDKTKGRLGKVYSFLRDELKVGRY